MRPPAGEISRPAQEEPGDSESLIALATMFAFNFKKNLRSNPKAGLFENLLVPNPDTIDGLMDGSLPDAIAEQLERKKVRTRKLKARQKLRAKARARKRRNDRGK